MSDVMASSGKKAHCTQISVHYEKNIVRDLERWKKQPPLVNCLFDFAAL